MNYFAEIRAFFEWVQLNAVPADAQALWHALMWLNNKCAVKVGDHWEWPTEFTVPNSTLISFLSMSRQQLDRMRNLLVQVDRISYRKGKGSKAGTYRIIPFVSHNVTQFDTQPVTQTDTQTGHNLSTLDINTFTGTGISLGVGGGDAGAREAEGLTDFLVDLNAYFGMTEAFKQEVAGYAEEIFGRHFERRASARDMVRVFEHVRRSTEVQPGIWQVDMDAGRQELLEYALEAAAAANAMNWRYVDGVLDNVRRRGLTTRAECEEYDVEREFARSGH